MKAVVLSGSNQLAVADAAAPEVAEGGVVVALRTAALNHRDVWIKLGQYAGIKYPSILGSDGAGVVVEAGAAVDRGWIGREVVINPSLEWGANERAQGAGFNILGLPREGTLAERVAVPAAQLARKPEALTWEESAALPLGGLTAWRAVFSRAKLKKGERILITGIGGGVAVFALQFAVAAGAEAWVTSSSPEKIARAVLLGAKGGFDYSKEGWAKEAATAAGAFDVIIDSAGGPGFSSLVDLAAPGGRIAFFGATRGDPGTLPMRKIFWRQLSLLGSTMGSPRDWTEMVTFVGKHRIKPVVSEVFPLARATEAFELMERGGQFGKIVMRISD
ncbi:zinc-binding dehydrogenase [Termitidicoccus mucosus]|uniref:Alcohol dehydrogenase n=1 Tax=Termitidicoccus mucosus TaxID=1184151 RepID=A0A178IET2_9BACT|nr:alcohol dehydrogenase [Opitutaceae bacterium TSB47]